MKNYCFDVNDKFKSLILECLDELQKLNFPLPNSVYFREGKGKTGYGLCAKGDYYNKYKNWDFVISVNKYLFEKNDIKETVIHELLHTLDMTHGGKWKEWATFKIGRASCRERVCLSV